MTNLPSTPVVFRMVAEREQTCDAACEGGASRPRLCAMTPDRQKQLADGLPRRASRAAAAAAAERLGRHERPPVRGRRVSAPIATTSGGARLGRWAMPTARRRHGDEVVAAHERIVRAVRVPVTADIEAGYGDTPDEVGKSIAEIIAHRRGRLQPRGRHAAPRHAGAPDRGCRRAHPRRARGRERGRRAGGHQRAGRSLPQERRRSGEPLRRDGAARPRPISPPARTASIRSASSTWTSSRGW